MVGRFKEFQERGRYLLDRAFSREFAGQLILFLVLVVVVTFLGMTAIFFGLFSSENADIPGIPRGIDQGFWDSMWWSVHQVLRLRGVEKMYGATGPVIAYSIMLSVTGLAVFGILVSLINNTMRSRIEALRKGETRVMESGHVLVLGWNNKVFSVLRQLARREPGIRAVILAPMAIDKMRDALRVRGIDDERITVILRTGMPSNRKELERVAINRASSVIILSTDGDDSQSIKTLVLLAAKDDWRGEPPCLTSEIALEENCELAEIAARERLHIISSSKVISKVIVQTIRNPGLSAVYNELFSSGGEGIYVQHMPELADRTLAEIAFGLSDAIPIGITWDEKRDGQVRHAAALNLEADYDITEEESLVLLASKHSVHCSPPETEFASDIYQAGGGRTRVRRQVLLIGWTDIIYDILMELDAHALAGSELTLLSSVKTEEARERISRKMDRPLENLELHLVEGDAADPTAFEETDLCRFHSIVVLADEEAAEGDVDTHTLRILLRMSNLRKETEISAHTIVELLDATNVDLLQGLGVDDVVVSPIVVSAQLAQIARQRVLGPIYRELLSAGGMEISFRPAGQYVQLGCDCRFVDLAYAAQQKMETALGLRLERDGGQVLLNPDRSTTWQLSEGDQVIVLAQQLYT